MKLALHHITALLEQRYIDRGKAYFEQGMVEILHFDAAKVTSRCAGTRLYKVELALESGRLTGHCTCPAFSDFGPCKHMAATAFAAIAHSKNAYQPSPRYADRASEYDALERRLKRMTKSELIDIILQNLGEDEELMSLILDPDEWE